MCLNYTASRSLGLFSSVRHWHRSRCFGITCGNGYPVLVSLCFRWVVFLAAVGRCWETSYTRILLRVTFPGVFLGVWHGRRDALINDMSLASLVYVNTMFVMVLLQLRIFYLRGFSFLFFGVLWFFGRWCFRNGYRCHYCVFASVYEAAEIYCFWSIESFVQEVR